MNIDAGLLIAFLLVFCRAAAMLMTAPIFGAQSTPMTIRVFTTLALAGALTMVVRPQLGVAPQDLAGLAGAVFGEVVAGLLIGGFCTLVMQAVQMGGAFLDIQVGLGSSQVLNPVSGVPVTLIAQFKFMLGLVIFMAVNAHHMMLQAFAESFRLFPPIGFADLPRIQEGLVGMVGHASLLALQIAAPVAAVGFVVDASLGLISKAAPSMQVFMLGLPAKIALGLLTISLALPSIVAAIQNGVNYSFDAMFHVFK